MNELVYLFELDSVRNSPQEILLGQQALFREIVLKGNRVVLSFNQLTDAEGFLCAVRTPQFYAQMCELFSLGAMKYSRFAPNNYHRRVDADWFVQEPENCRHSHQALFQDEIHTPQYIVRTGSHYMQNAIERCLNSNGGRFLFSALPFCANDKPALSTIYYALRYSDLSILDELEGIAGADISTAQLASVKAYIQFILHLSRAPLAYNPPKLVSHPDLEKYLSWVLAHCQSTQPSQNFPLWPLLQQGAMRIEELWPTVCKRGKVNNRSDWYAAFRLAAAEGKEQSTLCMAEAIVDLSYNYTVAASIHGLCHNIWEMETFWQDFLRRLPPYWENGQQGVHVFLKPDSTTLASLPSDKKLPRWDTAVRLIQHVPSSAEGERKSWKFCIVSSLFYQIRSAVMYIALFVAISAILDSIESLFVLGGQQIFNPYLLSLITILVFGVFGSKISSWFNLPDIWHSFRQFGIALRDSVVLLHAWWRDRHG